MNYTRWIKENLCHTFLKYDKKRLSVWYSADNTKKRILLVHGLSGDYTGMIPLASELSDRYSIVVLELPGHGASDCVDMDNVLAMQNWFSAVFDKIENTFGKIDAICAHSFGCSIVLGENLIKSKSIILICPVPQASKISSSYSHAVTKSSRFLANIYNARPFNIFRGLIILRVLSVGAIKRVFWVSLKSHQSSFERLMYQAGLVNLALDGTAFDNLKSGNIKMVLSGLSDIVLLHRTRKYMSSVFGSSEIVLLKGGHILQIESPRVVANHIKRAIN